MAGIVRLGDICSGHGLHPPRGNTSASSNVFVNGIGVHRLEDTWASHCAPGPACHSGYASTSSESVFANGLGICRIGDSVSCGSTMVSGSDNVFAG